MVDFAIGFDIAASILNDLSSGRTDGACRSSQIVIADEPGTAWAWQLLAATWWQVDASRAEVMLRRTLALSPADLPALNALVATLTQRGRGERTRAPLRRLLALVPGDPACMASLAGLSETKSDWARRALATEPASEEIALLAIGKLLSIGDAPAAAKVGAGVHLPRTARLQAARICASFLLEEARPETSLALARDFDARFARPLTVRGDIARKLGRAGGRLRIGYLAGRSFARHTTAFTLLPTIEGHDRDRIEAFCYSDVPGDREDEITARFRAASTGFRDVSRLSDDAVAAAIVDDDIDVIIDSLGYPPGSRLRPLQGARRGSR